MRGKHFRMRVNVHTRALCLLQQHFEIPQIMTGNEDAGVLADADVHAGNFRISVSAGVGLVQQRHALHAKLAGLQRECHEVIRRKAVIQRFGKGRLEKCVDIFIILQERICMLQIRRKALETVGDEFPQRPDIFVLGCKHTDLGSAGDHFCFVIACPERSLRKGVLVFDLREQ